MSITTTIRRHITALAAFCAIGGMTPISAANPPASYNVGLASVFISNTRSRHEDTVYAQFSLSVNGTVLRTVRWDGTCSDRSCADGRDMNNGLHVFGRAVSVDTDLNGEQRGASGQIGDTDKVTWTFQIINSGHSPSNQNYTDAAAAASKAACQGDGDNSGWACIAGNLVSDLTGLFTANCDGPLAADSVTMTGAQFYQLTGALRHPYIWSRTYSGVDSPSGCGSNSIYRVDVIVEPDH
jgi:hypothetical protein